jgi:aldehyde dehydrogenase (NAD+)
VTLELGGKSPAIVAADADVDIAAHRITWGRFTNAGQTCVAPDYVLVHRDVEDELLGGVLRTVHDFYGDDPRSSADYGRIVDERHFDRLTGLIAAGGYEAVVTGGVGDRETRYLAPTVLAGVQPDAAVMQEEIFGPILPVLTVADVDEAVRFVNERPAPLAMYVFTSDDAAAERVIERTTSGGVTVNHTMLHVAIPDLPFGGVGESGIGAYHGKAGFDTFSHRRAVLAKPSRPDVPVLYPPYKRWKEAILRRVL